MANPYEVTPADPMGALNDWRQQLANTAMKEEQAKQAPLHTEQMKQQLQEHQQKQAQLKQQQEVSAKFSQLAGEIPKDLPQWEKDGKLAELALQTGDTKSATAFLLRRQQELNLQGVIAQREDKVEASKAKRLDEASKRVDQFYSAAESPSQWAGGHTLYKALTGQDSPYAKIPWFPGINAIVSGDVTKRRDNQARALDEAKARRDDALAKKSGILADTQAELARARIKELDGRAAKNGKAGGKILFPHRGEMTSAETLVRQYFPGIDDASVKENGRQVAVSAKALQAAEGGDFDANVLKVLKNNPGLVKTTPATGTAFFGHQFTGKPEGKALQGKGELARGKENVSKEGYEKLKPGDKYFWNGKELTKG